MKHKRLKATLKHWCLKFGISFSILGALATPEQWGAQFNTLPQLPVVVGIGLWTLLGVLTRWTQHEHAQRWAVFQSLTGLLFCLIGLYCFYIANPILASFCFGLAWASDECGYLHSGFTHVRQQVNALNHKCKPKGDKRWSI